tara:strand:+ start:138 stop:527 length:390 start_codon:yes stop_codon:yes gene_type:complete
MIQAAREENDHLLWCQDQLETLGGNKSLLNPVWYAGSFLIGASAGLMGDRWSLGFLSETEQQVEKHLQTHLERLPKNDLASKAIVSQMKEDESNHATAAIRQGATQLPTIVKKLMALGGQIMTRTSHWI